MDVIDEIGYRPTGAGPAPELTKDVPKEPIVIKQMKLLDTSAPVPVTTGEPD